MSGYRAYITVHGDDGKRLGKVGLAPVVANLNAHARARAEDGGWPLRFDPFRVQTHIGRPTVVMHVDEAWQVRVAWRAASMFLNNTGWRFVADLNANTRRAL
jgi:hypothetical protein